MNARWLSARLERLTDRVNDKQDKPDDPVITCFWQGEQIPDEPGVVVIHTQWGRGTDPRKRSTEGYQGEYEASS